MPGVGVDLSDINHRPQIQSQASAVRSTREEEVVFRRIAAGGKAAVGECLDRTAIWVDFAVHNDKLFPRRRVIRGRRWHIVEFKIGRGFVLIVMRDHRLFASGAMEANESESVRKVKSWQFILVLS